MGAMMTDPVEALVSPLRHSPLLPEIADVLQRQVAEERRRRIRFYEEMNPSQKVEFIDGEVIGQSPARNSHLNVTLNISQLLTAYVRKHRLGEIKVEKCLCVFPRNDYEPDIVFFGLEKAAKFAEDTMKFPIPDFIVEVLSESTEARDRGVKFEDFAVHGVGEYWIVDAEQGVVEQYLLKDNTYALAAKTGSGEIRSKVVSGLVAPVSAFFDADDNLAAVRQVLAAP